MRTFLEVTTTGSFLLSAEKLHVTQSTISARIKSLENQLNQKLIIRNRNGCSLTTAGRIFQRHAYTAVTSWDKARQEIALPDDMIGTFILGVQLNHWDYFAPSWLDYMQTMAPNIVTRVISEYSISLMNLLKDGLIDMAIVYEPIHHPSITIDKLMDEKLVLVSTEPRSIESGQVEGYVFVDWGYGFTTQHNLAFPDAHNPKISFAIADTALNHVLKNGGSGYFSEASIQPLLKTKECYLVEGAPIFNRPLYLGYSKNGMNSKLFNDSIKALDKTISTKSKKNCRNYEN
ncbi:MAG: LysR family transcriptional regulator [Thiotrichales bacterium]|jgi:DNA-binding transcriptional LysR family regulator|nr:LysR family transcriptional regulator [Thiotrichales bacterium]